MSSSAGRLLAIDLGEARMGLALSDPLRITAQPLRALECVGPRRDAARIAEIVAEHGVQRVIVGLPLRLSGEEGGAAARAREFAERLRRRLGGVPVELWDERLSTAQAERTLVAAGVGRAQRRRSVDAMAAALILQSYLDARGADR